MVAERGRELEIWKSGNPELFVAMKATEQEIRKSGNPEIRKSGNSWHYWLLVCVIKIVNGSARNFRIFGFLDFQFFKLV